jgi:fatty acid cis/trans isomerase CTI
VGDTPLTGWVVDYPNFERIHYLLVAEFNVYGSAGQQLATRMYMDFLRMNAENNFLRFMPGDQRQQMYESWYQGSTGRLASFFNQPYFSAGHETGVVYQTEDVKKEFISHVRLRLGRAAGTDFVQCTNPPCMRVSGNVEVDQFIGEISLLKGRDLRRLPEVSFLRVKTGQENTDLVYTLLLNKALQNVAIPVAESIRREPGKDTVTIVPGFIGSHPNFFFSVEVERLQEFVEMLQSARSKKQKERFYS